MIYLTQFSVSVALHTLFLLLRNLPVLSLDIPLSNP